MMKLARSRSQRRSAGFTLIEMMVSSVILSILLGAVVMFQMQSNELTRDSAARAQVETEARRVIDQIATELTGVGHSLLVPDPLGTLGTDTITFQKPLAVSATGVVTWSTRTRIGLVIDAGEVQNGVDDDGDGLIDERNLVMTRNVGTANEIATILCHDVSRWYPGETGNVADDNGNGVVDESGFNVQRTGDLLSIRLSIEQPTAGGQTIVATAETGVVLRN
jgi:prepilin-type N-terminal cleavage/methylation domain-containing protein